ncbi:MAG: GAF domain-containing protein, partial [Gemmatimonadota bacterium]
EWWEPARELGFTAMTAHPLTAEDEVVGVISFYYHEPQQLDDSVRALLATAAGELATAAGELATAAQEVSRPGGEAPDTGLADGSR